MQSFNFFHSKFGLIPVHTWSQQSAPKRAAAVAFGPLAFYLKCVCHSAHSAFQPLTSRSPSRFMRPFVGWLRKLVAG